MQFDPVDAQLPAELATELEAVLDQAVLLSGSSGGVAGVWAPWAGEWSGASGTVDFTAVFRSLARIGYDGPIAFESFSSAVVDPVLSNMLGVWRNLWSDGYDLARHAKTFMEAQRHAAAQAVAAGA